MAIDYQEGIKRITRAVGMFWLSLTVLGLIFVSLLILIINIISIMVQTGNMPWTKIAIVIVEMLFLGGFGYFLTRKFSRGILWIIKGFLKENR